MKGALLAAAVTADVFAWGRDDVLKLFRPEFAHLMPMEAARTRAVHAAGLPCPDIRDEIEVEGRPGIVMERIEGRTLLSDLAAGVAAVPAVAQQLATIQIELHHAPPAALPRALETLGRSLAADPDDVHALVVRALPDGDAVAHGDLHPGNVILAPQGPVVLDWVNAHLAHPSLDVARSFILLRYQTAAPETEGRNASRLALRQALADAYLECIFDVGHITRDELAPAMAWAASTLLHSGAIQESDRQALEALEALAIGPPAG